MSLVKLLPAWLHAVADYAVGLSLIGIALIVGGAAKSVLPGVVVGAVVVVVSLLTRYPLGVIKVLPFQVHSAGDYLAAALLIASPFALGFLHTATPLSVVYLTAGVAVLGVSLITNYQYSPKRQEAPGWALAQDSRMVPAQAEYQAPAAPQPAPVEGFDARGWYEAAVAQRASTTGALSAPEANEPVAFEASPRPNYGAANRDPGPAISLREAIASNRHQEAS